MSRDTAATRQCGRCKCDCLQPSGEPAIQQQIACGNSSALLRFMSGRFFNRLPGLTMGGKFCRQKLWAWRIAAPHHRALNQA